MKLKDVETAPIKPARVTKKSNLKHYRTYIRNNYSETLNTVFVFPSISNKLKYSVSYLFEASRLQHPMTLPIDSKRLTKPRATNYSRIPPGEEVFP